MANVGLLTASTTHAAATNTKSALEAKGHTVTLIADSAAGTHDFTQYAAVVATRTASDTTVAGYIHNRIIGLGVPLILGTVDSGVSSGSGVTVNATRIGLLGTVTVKGTSLNITGVEIQNNTHPVTSSFALGHLDTASAASFWAIVDSGGSYLGTLLATGDAGTSAGLTETVAVESGTNVGGVTSTKRIVVGGWVYGGQGTYTANGQTLLDNAVSWVTAASTTGLVPSLANDVSLSSDLVVDRALSASVADDLALSSGMDVQLGMDATGGADEGLSAELTVTSAGFVALGTPTTADDHALAASLDVQLSLDAAINDDESLSTSLATGAPNPLGSAGVASDVSLAATLETWDRLKNPTATVDESLAVSDLRMTRGLKTWTRDEWDKVQEDVELFSELDVFPLPEPPPSVRMIRRRSETYPDPVLTDGRPT